MPTMPLSHKLKLFFHFIEERRFREIYNMFWVYPLWWNRKMSYLLLNKLFPKLGIDLFPPFLEIEPTTICNFRCICCEHTYWKEPPKSMTFEQFQHIFDQFNRPKWLGLTGIGSSYLNKDFHKMVAYAKSKGTIIELMDHFAHFKDENQIKELIEIGPDFQFVSTYGATKSSFEKVCVGSSYETIIENIKTFVRLKKQLNKKFPILNFHYIITSVSKHEALEFLDFVDSLNTEIGEILMTPMLHYFKEAKEFAVSIDEDYIFQIKQRAKKYKIPITINMCALQEAEGLEKRPSINQCKEYIMPFIFASGDITPCCGQNEANQRHWQKSTSPGNLLRQNLRKIWYSKKYKDMRNMIRKNKCPNECSFCPAYNVPYHRGKTVMSRLDSC